MEREDIFHLEVNKATCFLIFQICKTSTETQILQLSCLKITNIISKHETFDPEIRNTLFHDEGRRLAVPRKAQQMPRPERPSNVELVYEAVSSDISSGIGSHSTSGCIDDGFRFLALAANSGRQTHRQRGNAATQRQTHPRLSQGPFLCFPMENPKTRPFSHLVLVIRSNCSHGSK